MNYNTTDPLVVWISNTDHYVNIFYYFISNKVIIFFLYYYYEQARSQIDSGKGHSVTLFAKQLTEITDINGYY